MNTLLSRHRPKDLSKAEFDKLWTNAGYTLEALYKTIQELQSSKESVKETDFDCPNHYAKLAYRAGYKAALVDILDMLPPTAKE